MKRNRDGEAAQLTDIKFRFKDLTSKRIVTQQQDAFFKGEAAVEGGGEYGVTVPEVEENLKFVSYEDFAKTADPKWSTGRRKFEWNRLVLDKAS